jgi:hypothetical protein
MARHYSTRDFFRQMPNALLDRYFQARGLFGDLDFSAMKETQPDELFAAWLDLPDGQRNEMDAEFRDIFELSCEKGFRAIIDEAEWHLTTDPDARTGLIENLAALSNHYERAMVTFLDHNQSGRVQPASITRTRMRNLGAPSCAAARQGPRARQSGLPRAEALTLQYAGTSKPDIGIRRKRCLSPQAQ